MSVVKKLVAVFVILVVVATTGIIFSQKPTAAQGGPKWYTEESKCDVDCPSLDVPECNCFELPEIVVIVQR